jgi:hypothetical protein
MNTDRQITIRAWRALPRTERAARTELFHTADEALQANGDAEQAAGINWETSTYLDLNSRVNDLWPTVPWWVRSKALPETPASWAGLLTALIVVVTVAIWVSSR